MRIFVDIEPETIYIGRVKDEVKTVETRMWFETNEDVEVLSLADYTKQVRKQVCEEIRRMSAIDIVNKQYIVGTEILDQIQGEKK